MKRKMKTILEVENYNLVLVQMSSLDRTRFGAAQIWTNGQHRPERLWDVFHVMADIGLEENILQTPSYSSIMLVQ